MKGHLHYMFFKKVLKNMILITLIMSAAFACNRSSQEETAVVVPVETFTTETTEIRETIQCSGILSTSKQQKLGFKTGGIIQHLTIDEGTKVRQGQLLASLQQDEITARTLKAREAVKKAKRDFERVKNLYADSVATLEQYQDTETALELAEADLKIAGFNLKHSTIEAPTDGHILKLLAEESEVVGPGIPVILFGSTKNNWILKVNVTDKEVVRINTGDSAQIQFDAYPSVVFRASVTEIGNAADPYTSTYEVHLEVINKPGKDLVSGFIGKALIFCSLSENYISLPAEAIINATEMSGYVYILQDNKPVKKPVEITGIKDDRILIKKTLPDGIQVITEGVHYVDEDTEIKVIK